MLRGCEPGRAGRRELERSGLGGVDFLALCSLPYSSFTISPWLCCPSSELPFQVDRFSGLAFRPDTRVSHKGLVWGKDSFPFNCELQEQKLLNMYTALWGLLFSFYFIYFLF